MIRSASEKSEAFLFVSIDRKELIFVDRKESQRLWYARNRENVRTQQKEYYERNRSNILQKKKELYRNKKGVIV